VSGNGGSAGGIIMFYAARSVMPGFMLALI